MKRNLTKYLALGAAALALTVGCLAVAGCGETATNDAADDAATDATAEEASYTLVTDGVLTVGTSPDYPPFENLVDGEMVGYDIALGEAVAEYLGLGFETVSIQFDGIIPAIEAGGQCDVGISGISVDPKRAEQVDFTDSYYIDDQAVAVTKDSGITSDNVDTKLNDASMVIAVQSGTTGEDFAKENFPNATIKGYGNSTDAFAAMQAGKANAVITNKVVVESMLEAYADAEVVKTVATGEEYAIAVSKDNPGLTTAINEAIAALTADGTIDELAAEYLG